MAMNRSTFLKDVTERMASMPMPRTILPNTSSEKELVIVSTPEKSNTVGDDREPVEAIISSYAFLPATRVQREAPKSLILTITFNTPFVLPFLDHGAYTNNVARWCFRLASCHHSRSEST